MTVKKNRNQWLVDGKVFKIKSFDTKSGKPFTTAWLSINNEKNEETGNWSGDWVKVKTFGADAETLAGLESQSKVGLIGWYKTEKFKDRDNNDKEIPSINVNNLTVIYAHGEKEKQQPIPESNPELQQSSFTEDEIPY